MLTRYPTAVLSEVLISTVSMRHGLGFELHTYVNAVAPVSAVWPTSNRAFYSPIYIDRPGIVTKFWLLNGASVAGNVDIGLYRSDYTLISSKGSTAQAGTNVIQEFDVTDFAVTQGVYFLGVVLSNTGGAVVRVNQNALGFLSAAGMTEQTSAFPLPSTATPAAAAVGCIATVAGIAFRTLVA